MFGWEAPFAQVAHTCIHHSCKWSCAYKCPLSMLARTIPSPTPPVRKTRKVRDPARAPPEIKAIVPAPETMDWWSRRDPPTPTPRTVISGSTYDCGRESVGDEGQPVVVGLLQHVDCPVGVPVLSQQLLQLAQHLSPPPHLRLAVGQEEHGAGGGRAGELSGRHLRKEWSEQAGRQPVPGNGPSWTLQRRRS